MTFGSSGMPKMSTRAREEEVEHSHSPDLLFDHHQPLMQCFLANMSVEIGRRKVKREIARLLFAQQRRRLWSDATDIMFGSWDR